MTNVMVVFGQMSENDHVTVGRGHMAENDHVIVGIIHMAENEHRGARRWLRGKKYSHVTAMSGFIYNVLTCVGAAKLEGSSSRDPVIPMDSELYGAYLHTDIG